SGSNEVFLGRDINNDKNYSEAIAQQIDQETQSFINGCYDRAKEILTEHSDQLKLIAEKLLEVETLDAEEIKSLFEDGVMPEVKEKDEQATEEKVVEKQEKPTDLSDSKSDADSDVKVTITPKEDDEVKPDTFEEAKEKKNEKEDAKTKAKKEQNDNPENKQ